MSTRSDLLAVAEGLAAEARRMFDPDEEDGHLAGAARLAAAAKTALEAAALAQDDDTSAVVAAMTEVLADAGLDTAGMDDPAKVLARVLDACRGLQKTAQGLTDLADRQALAYGWLRDFAATMERDWLAADSDASRRLAARARAALDEAAQLVEGETG